MSDSLNETLASTIGVEAVADRLLRLKKFDGEAEKFFLLHHRILSWRALLEWLSRPEFDPESSPRPISSIVTRVAETFGAAGDMLAAADAPRLLVRVQPLEVRDEVIDAFQRRVEPALWYRFVLLASGGTVFNKIRSLESRLSKREEPYPHYLVDEGTVPCLALELFETRRDDTGCLDVIRRLLQVHTWTHYIVWVLSKLALLTQVGDPSAVLGEIPTAPERRDGPDHRARFLLEVAWEWPDARQRKQWFVHRSLAAVKRGIAWPHLWWEIPPELRDDVAMASLETATPAPWSLRSISLRADAEAWRMVFAFLERAQDDASEEFGLAVGLHRAANVGLPSKEMTEAFEAMDPRYWARAIARMQLPPDTSEDFDTQYIDLAERVGVPPHTVVDRLLNVPLSRSRARRITKLALVGGFFWTHPRRHELAEEVHGWDDGEVELPTPVTEDAVELFGKLVGERARVALAARLCALLDNGEFHWAVMLANAARGVVTEANLSELQRLAWALPLSRLAAAQASYPWLISIQEVVVQAMREERDDWGNVESLPEYLRPAIEAKVTQTRDAGLAASLLDYLERSGHSRRQVLELARERIRKYGPEAVSALWLGRRLSSTSLWTNPGEDLVFELIGLGDQMGVEVALKTCIHATLENRHVDLGCVMHTTLGSALVALAERALAAGDDKLATNALKGLAYLNAAPRLRKRVRELRRFESDDTVRALIDVNERLLRRSGDGDAATLDEIRDALAALISGSAQREEP